MFEVNMLTVLRKWYFMYFIHLNAHDRKNVKIEICITWMGDFAPSENKKKTRPDSVESVSETEVCIIFRDFFY